MSSSVKCGSTSLNWVSESSGIFSASSSSSSSSPMSSSTSSSKSSSSGLNTPLTCLLRYMPSSSSRRTRSSSRSPRIARLPSLCSFSRRFCTSVSALSAASIIRRHCASFQLTSPGSPTSAPREAIASHSTSENIEDLFGTPFWTSDGNESGRKFPFSLSHLDTSSASNSETSALLLSSSHFTASSGSPRSIAAASNSSFVGSTSSSTSENLPT
mmetsp:Transcript_24910/g.41024  ORF Transcript_24910/g.41024 Transcript_24910/m.41024 type:complete len:214 (-) Transcript_24910:290-931(-)